MDNEVNTTSVVETESVDNSTNTIQDKTDYRALYEAAVAERAAKDAKITSLSDDLKKYQEKEKTEKEKENASLPEDERMRIALGDLKKEKDSLAATNAALCARLNRIEIDKEFANRGYAESDYSGVSEILSSDKNYDGDDKYTHRIDIAKSILDFVDKVKKQTEESVKIGTLRDGIVFPNGGEPVKTQSDFKKYQESRTGVLNTNRVNVKF